jgi:hypothetical protein
VTLGLAAVLAWTLSIGPASWASSRLGGEKVVTLVYRPLTRMAEATGNVTEMNAIERYSGFGAKSGWAWAFSPDEPGKAQWSCILFDFRLLKTLESFSVPQSLPLRSIRLTDVEASPDATR